MANDDLDALRQRLREELGDAPLSGAAHGPPPPPPSPPPIAPQQAAEGTRRTAAPAPGTGRALANALLRELGIVLVAAALIAVGLFCASLALTFTPQGASVLALIAAAWEYFRLPLGIAALACWLMGAAFDLLSLARGGEPWSRTVPGWHLLLVLVAPTLCVVASANRGYVSPQTWSYIVATPAIGHGSALVARYLREVRLPGLLSRPGAVLVCVFGMLTAASFAPAPTTPTPAAQAAVNHPLGEAVPLGGCKSITVQSHSPLLRDSLRGDIRCQQGGFRASFLIFRSKALLDLYSSQREATARGRARRFVTHCQTRGGTYIGEWHNQAGHQRSLGTLLCYPSHGVATIETSYEQDDLYSIVTYTNRPRLYSWWTRHSRSLDALGY